MPKLKDYPILDFSGGLMTNRSDYYVSRRKGLKFVRNFDLDNEGRLKRRRGFYQYGNTLTGTISKVITSFGFGTSTVPKMFAFSLGANANIYSLSSITLASTLTPGASTATVINQSSFAASGTFEVDGDIVTYTSKTGTDTLNVTGSTIRATHLAGTVANQWSSATATGVDSRAGLYITFLNAQMLVGGRGGAASTPDGTTFSACTTNGGNLFLVNYRDRVYGASDGASFLDRVYYSNLGTALTWTATDFFDVTDVKLEQITGLSVKDDNLLIWKLNSLYSYDETQLKQRLTTVGAYNNEVIQEIDGLVYTFCPAGVFVTSGAQATCISEPIADILKTFRPMYDSTYQRVVDNCFAGVFDKKYVLYLSGINGVTYLPDNVTRTTLLRGVCLVYDTVDKKWTMYTDFTNSSENQLYGFLSTNSFAGGIRNLGSLGYTAFWQSMQALFSAGGADSVVYRHFEDSYSGLDSNTEPLGGDVAADCIQNSAGRAIACEAETALDDLGNPSWWKKFPYVRVLVERGDFHISYRLDKGTHITDWISLGNFHATNTRKPLKDMEGYRIAFKVTNNQADTLSVLNGLILEEPEAITKHERN